jgi:Icc-related predicted phosphoesterase
VIRVAEQVVRLLIQVYAAPVKTFDEFQEFVGSEDIRDPLKEFSKVCRGELRALRH